MNRRYFDILRNFVFLVVTMATVAGIASAQDGGNPFAPEKAPPLPAGMTGSDNKDPRFTLKPGVYDAGEFSFGIKHLALLKN